MADEPYETLSNELCQSTNQAKPLQEGKDTYPNDPEAQEAQHQAGHPQAQAKPEHPHGGPPGQTGEHPQGGPPGQADKPPEAEPKPAQQSRHR